MIVRLWHLSYNSTTYVVVILITSLLIPPPFITVLAQQDFSNFDYGVAQTLANKLLPIPDPIPESNDDKVTGIIIGVVVGGIIVLMLLIGIVGIILYVRLR